MRKVDVVVLDKTGTLTEGHPTATGWLWAQPQEEHFKDVLLAAELKSEHPLAGAIVAVLQDEEKITPAPLSSFESITGKGIKVSYQGKTYWVGSHKLLKDFSATVSDVMADMLVHYESDGNGIIYFGRENELLAIIAVSDPIKATSAEAVKELKRQGIDICMLTGDGQRTALAVSSVWVSSGLWQMPCRTTKPNLCVNCKCRERKWQWWAMVSMTRRHLHWLTSALLWERVRILLWMSLW